MKAPRRTRPLGKRQRLAGQALVFALVVLTAILIGFASVYHTGLVAAKRIELQNAADAAAYSTSVVEARDLNLMAYINKALIANEVAVGQLIGLVSWTSYWKSYGTYLNAYGKTLDAVTLGATSPITTPIANAFTTSGNIANKVLKPVAQTGSSFLHIANRVLSIAQQAFHVTSVAYSLAQIKDSIANNAPGATLSPYGWLTLAAHTVSFGSIPNPFGDFTRTHGPLDFLSGTSSDAKDEGWEQLAALIRASRDPFSHYRGWTLWLIPPGTSGPLTLSVNDSIGINLGIAKVGVDINFRFEFGINIQRRGGSELRYIGDPKDKNFNWSGADNSGMGAHLVIQANIDGYVDPIIGSKKTFNLGGLDVSFSDGRATLKVKVLGVTIPILNNVPAPTAIPFSGGAAQIGQKSLTPAHVLDSGDDFYGGAPTNRLSWVPGTTAEFQINKLKGYKGLPWYIDTTVNEPKTSFTAPYLILGLTYNEDTVSNLGMTPYGFSNLGRTNTNVGNDSAGGSLAAIARSEVYFSRPNEVSYFQRDDGQEEYANAFNPYWQARLVNIGYFDRLLALLIQQGQDFTGVTGSSFPSLPDPQDVFKSLMNAI
ncbi:MAG: pilus assembly protein TadG-related protein [Pseudomonadota bacterium]